jgi:hypothetical protein
MREMRLDCISCAQFMDFYQADADPAGVVRCKECEKGHSDSHLYMIDTTRTYRRNENGTLIEEYL